LLTYEDEHDLAYIRKGPPGRMGRTTVLITLHGSKHQVLGASARRPILVYQAAPSEEELLRIQLLRGWVNKLLSMRLTPPGGIMDVVANPLEKGRCTREQG
jgi:hypothetical protein